MNQKIKILFTIPNFDTAGSGKALLNIVTRLDANLFEPHICCSTDNGDFFEIVKSSNIPIHIFQTTVNMKPRIKGLLYCIRVARFFKKLKIDLIHSFHYAPDYSEAISAKFARIDWIYTKKNMNWGGKSKNGWILRTRLAKHIICQNKSMLTLLDVKKKVSLISRGVNVLEFKNRNRNISLLSQLGIKKDEKVITAVANVVPIKGLELLFEAFEILYTLKQNIHLLIVGDIRSPYAQELVQMTSKLTTKNKITFSGKVLNVIDYYSISDIIILTSKKESSPVTLLETMASCTPVLGSDIPGIREILSPFKSQLFSLDSKEQLAQKIFENLFKKGHSKKYLNKLRNHIIDNYSIELEVKKHQDLYLDINKDN